MCDCSVFLNLAFSLVLMRSCIIDINRFMIINSGLLDLLFVLLYILIKSKNDISLTTITISSLKSSDRRGLSLKSINVLSPYIQKNTNLDVSHIWRITQWFVVMSCYCCCNNGYSPSITHFVLPIFIPPGPCADGTSISKWSKVYVTNTSLSIVLCL